MPNPVNQPGMQHRWDISPSEAIAIQKSLRSKLRIADEALTVNTIAGVDVGFEDGGNTTRAAVVVLDAATLEPLHQSLARRPTTLPYIPGLLSFREIPAVLDALAQLRALPDLLMCDGQGLAHPRRMGIACHLGLLTDIPSIGVAKSRLTGTHGEVPEQRGESTPLYDGEDIIGAVLRTRVKVKPLFISPGHRVSVDTAVKWTMHCVTRYRLPATTRAADKLASNR